jgi:uncharacterized protein DUF1629
MKSYYLLHRNPMANHAFGIVGGPDDLDPVDFMQGKILTSVPTPIVLEMHEASGESGILADIGDGLYTVYSDRLRKVLIGAGVDNVDYFPARLVHPVSGTRSDDYALVNVLGLVEAVDRSKSTMTPARGRLPGQLRGFTIDSQRAGDLRLFRLAESPDLIVIEESVMAEIEAATLDGVFIQPTQDWSGMNGGPV